jgi:hypothetical protein
MGNHRSMRAASGRWGWRRVAVLGAGAGLACATVAGSALASGTSTPSVYSSIAPVTVLGKILAAGSSIDVTVAGVGSVPSNATSVQLSVTALSGTTTSSMYVYATGATKPTSANVRWQTGETVTIPVTVAVGTGGKIHLNTDGGTVTIKVAVVGYFSPADAPSGAGHGAQSNGNILAATDESEITSVDVPAGKYFLQAKSVLILIGGTADQVECTLQDSSGVIDTSRVQLSTATNVADISLMRLYDSEFGSTVSMQCTDDNANAEADDSRLVAIQLSSSDGDVGGD